MTTNPVEDYDAIPSELKQRDQWLLWDNRADRPKQPHWDGDHSISWSDPDDWHSFEAAKGKAEANDHWGIGYVTAKQNDDYPRGLYWVIDIDGGMAENGEIKDWVPELSRFTDALTYIERSPSGTGLHIPVVGYDIPEWWSDSQLDEHEGVDVLANKFCTFTGDTIADAGSNVADVDPTPWLYKTYQAINGQAPSYDPDDSTQYDGPDLSAEQISDALDHVDPDLEYQDWLRVGMAVYDWDSGSTGKRLFEQWSKTNPKWDESRGQHHIDDLFENDSPDGKVSLGTLIYHAKQGGWQPPSSNTNQETTDETRAYAFENVLDKYEPEDELEESEQKRVATLAARVDEEKYEQHRVEAAQIIDREPEVLDRHRELKRHKDEHGDIYVEDGLTYRLTGFPLYPYQIMNFPFTVKSILQMRDEERIEAEFGPGREVQFTPKKLQQNQRFKDLIGDFVGLTFDVGDETASQVLNDINKYIASLDIPRRTGTHHIGLHDDEYVLPTGVLTQDGWTDDPETLYVDRGIGVERKMTLTPDFDSVDTEQVAQILTTLPKTRDSSRMLPAMAWFYAAPLRPLVFDDFAEGAFNHLNVTGDTGSGKTTTLRYLWECFGVDGDPFDVTDTQFAKLATIASSNGLPIWYDEYKPGDIQDWRLDQFHDLYRKAATGGTAQRGNADKSTEEYHLHAPMVASGEQQITSPAERRRSIMLSFKTGPTQKGSEKREQFKRLVGADYLRDGELEKPTDAPDPRHHALAYYRWVLEQDTELLHDWWHEARKLVAEIRASWPKEHELDDMEIQGLQTIIWGWKIMRQFAKRHDVHPDAVFERAELNRALRHVVSEIGPDGERKSHLDRWVEFVERAAAMDYLERGTHWEVVHEGSPKEELRINGSQSFDAISKYVRDHGLDDADVLSNWGDYKKRFSEAHDNPDSYVVNVDQYTTGLGRCVGVSTVQAQRELRFDRMTFGLEQMDDADRSESESEGPPGDAIGTKSNAERLKRLLDDEGPMTKQAAAVRLVQGGELSAEDFDAALQKAVHELGTVIQDGDELRPNN